MRAWRGRGSTLVTRRGECYGLAWAIANRPECQGVAAVLPELIFCTFSRACSRRSAHSLLFADTAALLVHTCVWRRGVSSFSALFSRRKARACSHRRPPLFKQICAAFGPTPPPLFTHCACVLTPPSPSGPFSVTVPGDCREFYMNLIPTLPPNLRKFFTGTMTNTTTDAAGVSRVDASSVSFVTVPLAGSGRVEFGTVCGKVCKGTWTIEVEGGSVERESCFRGGSVVAVHFQRVGGSAAGAVGCELPVVYEMQGGESDSQVYDLMSFVVRGEDGGEEDQHVYCVVKKEGVWWKVSDESTMKIDLEEIYWEGLVMAFYWDGSLPEGGANLPAPPCSLHATARNNMLRSRKWATLCPPYGDLLIRLLSHSVDAMKLGLDGSTAVGRRVCVVWKNGDYTGTIVKFDANANRFHVRYVRRAKPVLARST